MVRATFTRRNFAIGLAGAFPQALLAKPRAESRKSLFFVGTYTRTTSKGIYSYRFDAEQGAVTPLGVAGESQNPSFLAMGPDGRVLYAVNEVNDYEGKRSGSVSAFSIDPERGTLKLLNRVASQGAAPAHLAVHASGRWLTAANYNGGSVVSIPIAPNGSLGDAVSVKQHTGSGPHPQRQQSPHPHQTVFSPDQRFVLVPDLGTDQIVVYAFDAANGKLEEAGRVNLPPGSGPRHISFDPSGKYAVLISELKGQLTLFSYGSNDGSLHRLETVSSLQEPFEGNNTAAEIAFVPGSRYWIASNRGPDVVDVFRMDKGRFSAQGEFSAGGKTPRHIAVHPGGRFLFVPHQGSDTVALFRIETKTGHLTDTHSGFSVPQPTCVAFWNGPNQ